MRVEDVVDRESLEAYLDGLPDDTRALSARRIAFFAAMSAAPYGVQFHAENGGVGKGDLTGLPLFCALAISGVAGTWQTPQIAADAAFAAANAALAAASAAYAAASAAAGAAGAAASAAASAAAGAARAAAASAADAAGGAAYAADDAAFWDRLRHLLIRLADNPQGSVGAITLDKPAAAAWGKARALLQADTAGDWAFWIAFYERALSGKKIYADELAQILNGMTKEDWLSKKVGDVNAQFQPVLDAYLAEDAGENSGTSERPIDATKHVKTIRSQVSTLRDFLDLEYLNLSGHNARSPEQDDVLELLRDLKAIVEKLMERLDNVDDEGRALVAVQENLPAVIEKAGELAIVETEPKVSATTITMAATIKLLVDSGADPKLATQIAMGDAAAKKLSPSWRRLFPWSSKSGDNE